MLRLALAGAVLGASMLGAGSAVAAGLYFSERGVRPLGRGGAFTAGADDLGAIWYNPAGVFDAGSEILFDASWLHFESEYTRQALLEQRDPNTGQVVGRYLQTFDPVEGVSPVIPIPTLAASFFYNPDLVLAFGVMAPYAAIAKYPETVDGAPAPQRYSLITLEGSAMAIVGAWAGYRPHPDWRIGGGLEVLVGKFVTTAMASGCVPEKFFCAPEQPEWDVLTELAASPIFAPSGNVGVKWLATNKLRVGAALQLPFFVRAPAQLSTRLPVTPAFEAAVQEGSDATVSFELPWSARVGVEVTPVERLAVELDVTMEGWAMHDALSVHYDDVSLRNIAGFPDPYRFPDQSIERNFENAYSVRVGGEYAIPAGETVLDLRGGASIESSAVPPAELSVLTIDMPKLTLGAGLSLHVGKARFDVVYAHVLAMPVEIDAADARLPILAPVRGNVSTPHYVNGGRYSASGDVLGLGFVWSLDGNKTSR
ncbi:MAG: hypothetical protein EXR75_14235 [Myxococcales bacterium]|nr:hypothetical protein [Myxococcales bacterium]